MDTVPIIIIGILFLIVVFMFAALLMFIKNGFLILQKQINTSVVPKSLTLSPGAESLSELAVELWRLEKRLTKAGEKLSEDENKAFQNSLVKLRRYLEKNDIAVIDYTGQNYNEGLNLDILSMEKAPDIKQSIIHETHEPAVTHKGILIKKAKVIVHEK
jgi:hypothetical protein